MRTCAACGTGDQPDGHGFCFACGLPLESPSCVSCSSALPAGARFCVVCGYAQGPARSGSDAPVARRVTSVLFGDLVGFTTLSESATRRTSASC